MSKEELKIWNEATLKFEEREFSLAKDLYQEISQSAKINYNIGVCYINLDQIENAINAFTDALAQDPYFSLAYFTRGNCYFLKEKFQESMEDYKQALEHMRSSDSIDYHLLGFQYELRKSVVLYNLGLVQIKNDLGDVALETMKDSMKLAEGDSSVESGRIYDSVSLGTFLVENKIFEVDNDLVYKPPERKISNLQKKDYLGSSVVVASVDTDNFLEKEPVLTRLESLKRRLSFRKSVLSPTPSDTKEDGDEKDESGIHREFSQLNVSCSLEDDKNDEKEEPEPIKRKNSLRDLIANLPKTVDLSSKSDDRPSPSSVRSFSPFSYLPFLGNKISSDSSDISTTAKEEFTESVMAFERVKSPLRNSIVINKSESHETLNEDMNETSFIIKLNYEKETRMMVVDRMAGFSQVYQNIEKKLERKNLCVFFRDEEGDLIRVVDEEDWSIACKISGGRLTLFCKE